MDTAGQGRTARGRRAGATLVLLWLLTLVSLPLSPASSAEVRIGLSLSAARDPHEAARTPSFSLHGHTYETLIGVGPEDDIIPQLALGWERVGEGSWRFHLRPDVRFHNGAPLTARDIVFSFCRARAIGIRGGAYRERLDALKEISVTGPHVLELRFGAELRRFPVNAALIPILAAPPGWNHPFVPEGCAGMPGYPPDLFARSGVKLGTGPYQVVEVAPNRVVLEANPAYAGGPPTWSRVTLLDLSFEERARALAGGQVDLVEQPPLSALQHLRALADVTLTVAPSSVVYYLQANHREGVPPGVSGTDGRNPFRDARVRMAIDLAIDRVALSQRVMGGFSTPVAQLAMPGTRGAVPGLVVRPPDLDLSRLLLAEAGFGSGFTVELLAPQTQQKMAEALCSMLRRVGITAEPVLLPSEAFFDRLREGRFALFYGGFRPAPGESLHIGYDLLSSRGAHNWGGVDDPEINRLLELAHAAKTVEEGAAFIRRAAVRAGQLTLIIPIQYGQGVWATRAGFDFQPRHDRSTLAMSIRPLSAPVSSSGDRAPRVPAAGQP